jgi:RecA/RadA recombinase
MLNGGIAIGSITQFYGGPGSGKTEICCNVSALVPSKYKKLIIRTGTKFQLHRIKDIAESRGLNSEVIMRTTLTAKAFDTNDLEQHIKSAKSLIWSDHTIKLLIVDSIIDLYRADESNHEQRNLPKRQHKLSKIMHILSNIAITKNIAVVITNQFFLGGVFMSSAIPTGGKLVSLLSNYIIYLKKKSSFQDCIFSAILIKEPLGSRSHTGFKITNRGISDF